MNRYSISILDYGMGNISSVANAFRFLKAEVMVIREAKEIEHAQKLVLPGVGSFSEAMRMMKLKDFISPLTNAVIYEKKPILGICLGMQIMALSGTEGGYCKGLGWIEGEVLPLKGKSGNAIMNHVGFNEVIQEDSLLSMHMFDRYNDKDFYFCHGYHIHCSKPTFPFGKTHYKHEFLSCFQKNNIWGVQFHPEKSQANGLRLLNKFINWAY